MEKSKTAANAAHKNGKRVSKAGKADNGTGIDKHGRAKAIVRQEAFQTDASEITINEIDASQLKNDIVFIDPKINYAFLMLFGRPGHEDLLLKLLDSIIPEYHIKSLTLGPQENYGDRPKSKKTIFDIRCNSEDGKTFNVEMQLEDQHDFNDRMLYYSTYPIREQIQRGGDSYKLEPVIMVSIIDFCLDEDSTTNSPINKFKVLNVEECPKPMTESLTFVVLELPKFIKKLKELQSNGEKMIWLLRNMDSLKAIPPEFNDEYFEKLFQQANFAAMSKTDQEEYIRAKLMAEIDRKSALRTAEEKGLAKGLALGEAKGLALGEAKGKAEGIAETEAKNRAEKLAAALNLRQAGVAIELIAASIGLSVEEIKAL